MKHRAGFTLLELLTVMLIMFMLMGMGTVAMKGLVQGSGVSGAVANIKSVLTQARQYAITKEQPVYVIFAKDGEKNSMTVCAKYGVCEKDGFVDQSQNYKGKYSVILEDPLPWGTNTLVGAIVHNLNRTQKNIGKILDNTVIAGGFSKIVMDPYKDDLHKEKDDIIWSKGDGVGFEVADVRYLPSGMEFEGSANNMPIVIFNPDGSAGENYSIKFTEMYVAHPRSNTLKVNKLTGWVEVVP